jgi:two-component system, LuxR family, sensor kinase FixL
LVNLLRNAIESMQETPINNRQLQVKLEQQDEMAVLSIVDQGCGISKQDEARLFNALFSTKPGGMGVGLNICRSIVEMHQGRLWFTRNPSGGTIFWLGLPIAS